MSGVRDTDRPDAPGEVASATVLVHADAPAKRAPRQTPFRRLESDEPARIVLRQVNPTDFELVEGFRYLGAAGARTVTPADLPRTDLASIPRFLSWFVGRYGIHTLAALLHDHLVCNGADLDPPVARHEADDAFRVALDELGVPFLRARIMWSAVALATRWRTSLIARAALVVWVLAALTGVTALVWSAVTLHPVVAMAALAGPIPFALLWGPREYRAGLVGGYTLWLIAVPAVANLVAYALYATAERAVRRLRAAPSPRRVRDLPPPPPYSAR